MASKHIQYVIHANLDNFPNDILIITAGKDNLAPEGEELAKGLEAHGKHVTQKRFEKLHHAWDKLASKGTREANARDAAYEFTIKFLEDLQ
jgi:acetyl esterase/lipase